MQDQALFWAFRQLFKQVLYIMAKTALDVYAKPGPLLSHYQAIIQVGPLC